MGVVPVPRLLLAMSLPMMVSMLVQALYNVVDSIFVSYISEGALTAVGLAFPVQNLMISVAVGTGVGINALLSKSLGEKNYDAANRCAENGIFLALVSSVVFAVAGALFSGLFMHLQSPGEEIAQMGTVYLVICTVCSFGMMFQVCFERLLQSTGKTLYTMYSQGLGAVINLILDPLLIFGIGPFPEMGIAGAAAATVIGQAVAALLGLWFNLRLNHEITLSHKGFRPNRRTIGKIYAVGLPSIVLNSIGSVMVFGINKILLAFSTTATAVFGIYFRLQSFIFMPVFGLNNGMVPIIAYNYGAKNKKRIEQTILYSTIYAAIIMAVGVAAFLLIPEVLLNIFNATEDLLAIGIHALRIISLCFIPAAFGIVISSTCQALGHGIMSLIMSVVRQLVVILPAAFLLARFMGLDYVWWAFPIAEIFSFGLGCLFMRSVHKKAIQPLA